MIHIVLEHVLYVMRYEPTPVNFIKKRHARQSVKIAYVVVAHPPAKETVAMAVQKKNIHIMEKNGHCILNI